MQLKKKKSYKCRLSRSFNQKNKDIFQNLIQSTDFSSVMDLDCPNSAYNTFMKLYTNIFNTAFPLRENVTPKNI